MPYQEKIIPLTHEASDGDSLEQMWEKSKTLLVDVLGTSELWKPTGIRDLPTICCFTMRPLTEFDVEQLRKVYELTPFTEALDQAGYFRPSGMITFEISSRRMGSRRMMDVGFHRVGHLTDGDVVLSLVRDGAAPHAVQQQASFIQGCGIEHSATMRTAQALEAFLRERPDQNTAMPFPRLIEIFSRS